MVIYILYPRFTWLHFVRNCLITTATTTSFIVVHTSSVNAFLFFSINTKWIEPNRGKKMSAANLQLLPSTSLSWRLVYDRELIFKFFCILLSSMRHYLNLFRSLHHFLSFGIVCMPAAIVCMHIRHTICINNGKKKTRKRKNEEEFGKFIALVQLIYNFYHHLPFASGKRNLFWYWQKNVVAHSVSSMSLHFSLSVIIIRWLLMIAGSKLVNRVCVCVYSRVATTDIQYTRYFFSPSHPPNLSEALGRETDSEYQRRIPINFWQKW